MRTLTLASMACLAFETSALNLQHKLSAGEKPKHTGNTLVALARADSKLKDTFKTADDKAKAAYKALVKDDKAKIVEFYAAVNAVVDELVKANKENEKNSALTDKAEVKKAYLEYFKSDNKNNMIAYIVMLVGALALIGGLGYYFYAGAGTVTYSVAGAGLAILIVGIVLMFVIGSVTLPEEAAKDTTPKGTGAVKGQGQPRDKFAGGRRIKLTAAVANAKTAVAAAGADEATKAAASSALVQAQEELATFEKEEVEIQKEAAEKERLKTALIEALKKKAKLAADTLEYKAAETEVAEAKAAFAAVSDEEIEDNYVERNTIAFGLENSPQKKQANSKKSEKKQTKEEADAEAEADAKWVSDNFPSETAPIVPAATAVPAAVS